MNLKKLKRPQPPEKLAKFAHKNGSFVPAPDLADWIRRHFIDESGALYRVEHAHLKRATLGCLWTSVPLRKGQKDVAATAQMPSAQGNAWAQARAKQQLREWFGIEPDFLLTFFAPDSAERDDIEFCALVRHELLHCGVQLDEFGYPKLDRDGNPRFAIVGHDVEEFVAVIEDFGVGAAAGQSRSFVAAAGRAPKIGESRIATACGLCLR